MNEKNHHEARLKRAEELLVQAMDTMSSKNIGPVYDQRFQCSECRVTGFKPTVNHLDTCWFSRVGAALRLSAEEDKQDRMYGTDVTSDRIVQVLTRALARTEREAEIVSERNTVIQLTKDLKSAIQERDSAREQVVWCFSENETPEYIQGSKGEHEINEPVTATDIAYLVQVIEREKKSKSDFIATVESRYFRTNQDTGAGMNTMFVWNLVRKHAGMSPLDVDDLPAYCLTHEKYHKIEEGCQRVSLNSLQPCDDGYME